MLVTGPRVLAAAGASGALVATVVVARVLRRRRQARPAASWSRRLRLPGLPLPAAALARAK